MSRTGRIRVEGGDSAFTLIELLVTISIILLLLSTLVIAGMTVRRKTRMKTTTGILATLEGGMAQYFDKFRDYPPDGYDSPVLVYGEKIQGSQCLAYFLMTPRSLTKKRADGTVYKVGQDPIIAPGDFPADSLEWTIDEMIDREEVPRIRDAFRVPLQYDRVETKGDFTHLAEGGHPDPRGDSPEAVTVEMGKYQIWSRGPDGKSAVGGSPGDDITSWQLR